MTVIPLKYIARVIPGQSPPGNAVKELEGGLPFIQGNAEFTTTSPSPTLQCDSSPKVANRGDVLISVRAPVGALNVADQPIGIGRGVAAVRAIGETDSRFVRYSLMSSVAVLRSVATGSTYEAVSADQVGALKVVRLSHFEQRWIADFLDDRVSRIDNIIAARRQQIHLVHERESGVFFDLLAEYGCDKPSDVEHGWRRSSSADTWRFTTLGRVLREFTNGFVGPTRDILEESGVRYVQGLHIKNGGIDFARRPYFVSAEWHAHRRRIHLTPGDILIVQTGDIGQVAMVPDDFGPASCHALQIARVDRRLVRPRYLFEYLRSGFGQQAMLSRATGAMHPHLEASVLRTPVAIPSLPLQEELESRIDGRLGEARAAEAGLRHSIDLLAEYKQSLITAAVTGQLDVTAASKEIPA